jgi:hypothetical protein
MQIQVSEPKNLFPLVKAKHAVLVGGGLELPLDHDGLSTWYKKAHLLNCIIAGKPRAMCLCR